jgi:uncharacterized repeat protein (TIGR03803 family)
MRSQGAPCISDSSVSRPGMAFAQILFYAVIMVVAQSTQAQTYTVLHTFTGGPDGGFPYAGLTKDQTGTLYGTACEGGTGFGVVYSIVDGAAGTTFTVIHTFHESDGSCPVNKVIFGPDGALYGTTRYGGELSSRGYPGWGTIFRLQPPPPSCSRTNCEWSEAVLYRFQGHSDGGNPEGDLIFDQAGNIYGTATQGGMSGRGAVFQLHPSNGGWAENVLYSFTGGFDGGSPGSGVILDEAGNLYGTTLSGGPFQQGVVFDLSPDGSGWTEQVLHGFQGTNDGAQPGGGLIPGPTGNLYGATTSGGAENVGVTYELVRSNGSWEYQILHSFTFSQPPGGGPEDTLFRDGAGNLYGSATFNPSGQGSIFKLASGTWTETELHVFDSCSEGCEPTGSVILDDHGNIYGTTLTGSGVVGSVWKITPSAENSRR